MMQSYDSSAVVTIEAIIQDLCTKNIIAKTDSESKSASKITTSGTEEEDQHKGGAASTSTSASSSAPVPAPALDSKQRHALVGRNIREMIKQGSIIGLPVQRRGIEHGYHLEYSYEPNPLFRRRDCHSCPVLCLGLSSRKDGDATPLRVFARCTANTFIPSH
jgi:hypothetical protein